MTQVKKTGFFQQPFVKRPLVWLYMKYQLAMALMLPDKTYLKWRNKLLFGKTLDLDHPVLFQEKLHWLKLNDRKPIYHQMVDKYDAKEFIASKIGKEFAIPTIGLYNNVDEIDFSKLPDQFVLKCTFDSGSYYICRDKSKIDAKEVKKRLTLNWNRDYYIWSREWPYKGLEHRIIAEPLLDEPSNLEEYKFFCFNGSPRFFQSITDRDPSKGGPILLNYSIDKTKLDLKDGRYRCRQDEDVLLIPKNLDWMIETSKKIAQDTCFLRVDFFEVKGKPYIGEMTFYENGGWCWFVPEHWNRDLGDWIKLPIDK